jgi:hypothetical protein
MKKKWFLASCGLVFCTVLLHGCATGAAVECNGVDWYQAGRRDATLDGRDESKIIAESCGTAFNAARYRQGFDEGLREKPKPKPM